MLAPPLLNPFVISFTIFSIIIIVVHALCEPLINSVSHNFISFFMMSVIMEYVRIIIVFLKNQAAVAMAVHCKWTTKIGRDIFPLSIMLNLHHTYWQKCSLHKTFRAANLQKKIGQLFRPQKLVPLFGLTVLHSLSYLFLRKMHWFQQFGIVTTLMFYLYNFCNSFF